MTDEPKCNLKWEWDEGGEWTAVSRAMDPDMVDEPEDQWCREWCLTWRIYVDKDGDFHFDETDDFLKQEDFRIGRSVWTELARLQERIEECEEQIRQSQHWNRKNHGELVPIVLLPAEKYLEGKS